MARAGRARDAAGDGAARAVGPRRRRGRPAARSQRGARHRRPGRCRGPVDRRRSRRDARGSLRGGRSARELRVHAVAHGAGRIADLDGLDLAAAGVATDGDRPRLDDAHCSRSNPDIWFAGDAVPGKPQLSALATYEGRLVARNLIRGETSGARLHVDPQRGLHGPRPGVGRTDRGGGAHARPDVRDARQRHAHLAIGAHLRRGDRVGQGAGRPRRPIG